MIIRADEIPFQPVPSTDWSAYLGSVWASLLGSCRLPRHGVVVEIGPGFTDKIARALARHGFHGVVYLVEPSPAACTWAAERYTTLLPDSRIVAVPDTLSETNGCLPDRVDALLMNHVLDDVVLGWLLGPRARSSVFDGARWPTPHAVTLMQRAWAGLLADPGRLESLARRAVEEITELTLGVEARVIGASQYDSWFLETHGLGQVNRFASGVMTQLRARFRPTSERDRAILSASGQDPDRWLFAQPVGWEYPACPSA